MPAVGSSRTATLGRPTSASARFRRCFCPPDRTRKRVVADALEERVGVERIGVEAGVEPEHLARRRGLVGAPLLEHDADTRDDGVALGDGVVAEDAHRAAVRSPEAAHALDRRRLARSVRAEDGGDRPGLGPQRDAVDDRPAVIGLHEVGHLHGGVHGCS
jgi:hypothetical protein